MSRRLHGEGSVFQRADGTWMARIEIEPGPNGKRRRRERTAATKREALTKLRQLQDEISSVDNVDGPKRKVAEAVATFIATKSFQTESTEGTYRWRADVITAGLGHLRIGDLTVGACDRFLAQAQAGEFGTRTINADGARRLRSLLVNSLHNEMRLGNLARNVADLSLRPEGAGTTGTGSADEDGDEVGSNRRTLTHDEYRGVWRAARYPAAVIVDLCGRNGLRPSEARGLRWECVDLDAMTIRIDRQANSRGQLTRTKTKRARRKISVDEITATVLETWRQQQEVKRHRAGPRWQADPAFVASTRYGTSHHASNLRRMITAICEDAAVDRIVPYELRHTAISFQCDAGHDTVEVADWAGTSVRMIEEIYRHRLHDVSKLSSVSVADLEP